MFRILSKLSPDTPDMPLKVTAVQERCDDELFKDRDGAGIESRTLLENRAKRFGQQHIAGAQGRCDRH